MAARGRAAQQQRAAAEQLAAVEAYLATPRAKAEGSLLEFIKEGWHTLEPAEEQRFVHGWAVEAICDALEAVTRGDVKRLLINVPPGCTKSMTTSVFWPAWEWGPRRSPHLRYILAGYEQGLSVRDNVRCRDVLDSEWYQENWGDVFEFKEDVNLKIRYENDATGWRQASSSRASLTGHRGDRIILDDPHSVQTVEQDADRERTLRWFAETLPTRLNSQAKSAIVVIMQRVHERDISGFILAKELGYEHVMLPMEFEPERRCFVTFRPSYMPDPKPETVYWHPSEDSSMATWRREIPQGVENPKAEERYDADPRTEDGELLWEERFPQDAVDDLKATFRAWGGSYAEAGQLQQRPAPRGGGMFQRDDFQYLDAAPERTRWIRGWDLGATEGGGDPTAGVKIGLAPDGRVIIGDVNKAQKGPAGVEAMLKATAEQDGKGVPIDIPQDPGQAGKAQKTALAKLLNGYDVHFSPETGDKVVRATPLAAQSEAGNLYLVRAPWNDAFVAEACLFPNGDHDDQIDAASRGHAALLRKRKKRAPVGPRLVKVG